MLTNKIGGTRTEEDPDLDSNDIDRIGTGILELLFHIAVQNNASSGNAFGFGQIRNEKINHRNIPNTALPVSYFYSYFRSFTLI